MFGESNFFFGLLILIFLVFLHQWLNTQKNRTVDRAFNSIARTLENGDKRYLEVLRRFAKDTIDVALINEDMTGKRTKRQEVIDALTDLKLLNNIKSTDEKTFLISRPIRILTWITFIAASIISIIIPAVE